MSEHFRNPIEKSLSVSGIDFASLCDFSIGFRKCSDIVVFFLLDFGNDPDGVVFYFSIGFRKCN
jgi:hypothetical protein